MLLLPLYTCQKSVSNISFSSYCYNIWISALTTFQNVTKIFDKPCQASHHHFHQISEFVLLQSMRNWNQWVISVSRAFRKEFEVSSPLLVPNSWHFKRVTEKFNSCGDIGDPKPKPKPGGNIPPAGVYRLKKISLMKTRKPISKKHH